MSSNSHIVKWGFGMAPLKSNTALKNRTSIEQVLNYVNDTSEVSDADIVSSISWVKGIFNRIIKQDQWDWFTVNMYFDYPSYRDLRSIISTLSSLRSAVISDDVILKQHCLSELGNANFITYCENYLNYNASIKTPEEYLYILSRREEPDILKIGMTTRNVQKRVHEINSATGVLYPYSARKVYKVKDCHRVERDVHQLLHDYRIREDREFFKISFKIACEIIEEYLQKSGQYFYA